MSSRVGSKSFRRAATTQDRHQEERHFGDRIRTWLKSHRSSTPMAHRQPVSYDPRCRRKSTVAERVTMLAGVRQRITITCLEVASSWVTSSTLRALERSRKKGRIRTMMHWMIQKWAAICPTWTHIRLASMALVQGIQFDRGLQRVSSKQESQRVPIRTNKCLNFYSQL